MNSILYPTCAAMAFLALIYKLRVLRTDRSVTQVALIGNFFFLSVTYTVSTPAIWAATSRTVGVVNFSGLLTQSCVILLTACQQLILLHLSYKPEVAWRKAIPRLIALATALIAMVALFSAATHQREAPNDFAVTKAQYYPAYLTVYLLAYAANQIDVGIMCWRYAKIAPTRWLRRGLFLIAMTLPFAMIYIGCRTADIVAGQFGTSGHAWEPVAQIAVTIATITKTLGWTLPDWGRYLSALWERIDCYRAYRELGPLHSEVTAQVPESVLRLGPGMDLRTRLYRRVVEIRDAQWALRLWMVPALTTEARQRAAAAGLHGIELAATIEAVQLRAALQAKALGVLSAQHTDFPRTAEPEDLAAEITFQRKLAHAFTNSPVVTDVIRQSTITPGSKELA
ncbi:hypothetical protein CD790_33145 [Streptomyces sp. SAJ15]|nr:hypothetical protein CD790_33145 [Streptomyces sp. SAJ15]